MWHGGLDRRNCPALELPESQPHFAFVDAAALTDPNFRLIGIKLNH
jgi:hypothetical protein